MAFFLPVLAALGKGALTAGAFAAKGLAGAGGLAAKGLMGAGKGIAAGFKTAFLPHLKDLPPGVLGPKQMVGGALGPLLKNPYFQMGTGILGQQFMQPQPEQPLMQLPMPERRQNPFLPPNPDSGFSPYPGWPYLLY